MALLLAVALIAGLKYGAPTWLLVALFATMVTPLAALLVAYFYCLFSGKPELVEALRTEHYSIQKLVL